MKALGHDPSVVSLRCLVADPGATYDWHSHPFEEFTLVTEARAYIGYGGEKHLLEPNTLCLYRRGESHGGWCAPGQTFRSWVVHFDASDGFYASVGDLTRRTLSQRVWRLSVDQAKSFRWFFFQILNERTKREAQSAMAESAWLKLLVIMVHRWARGETISTLPSEGIEPGVMRLWHLVNSCVGTPEKFLREIHSIPNYDSLRHAFHKNFGCSPREMMQRLRLQQAKNLLLETSLSIKEISLRVGYARQHEFTRIFHQQVGAAPSAWRANPIRSTIVL